jgi:hypothetical protein
MTRNVPDADFMPLASAAPYWLRDLDESRAERLCDQLAPVRAAVVGDEDFTVQADLRPNACERLLAIGDAGRQPFCLV